MFNHVHVMEKDLYGQPRILLPYEESYCCGQKVFTKRIVVQPPCVLNNVTWDSIQPIRAAPLNVRTKIRNKKSVYAYGQDKKTKQLKNMNEIGGIIDEQQCLSYWPTFNSKLSYVSLEHGKIKTNANQIDLPKPTLIYRNGRTVEFKDVKTGAPANPCYAPPHTSCVNEPPPDRPVLPLRPRCRPVPFPPKPTVKPAPPTCVQMSKLYKVAKENRYWDNIENFRLVGNLCKIKKPCVARSSFRGNKLI